MRIGKSLAIISSLALAGVGGAHAADMFGAPPVAQPALASPQMEFGTGWYLRGSVSASKDRAPTLSADIAQKLSSFGAGAEIGIGYNINNWFRMDVTGGWRKARDVSADGAIVTCPYALTGLSTQAATPVQLGYLWDSSKETCTPQQTAHVSQFDLMANGYFDLGTWSGITPYIGAGVGVSSIRARGDLKYYKTSDGSIYAADLTPTGTFPHIWIDAFGNPINPQPTIAFAKQNWARSINKSVSNLAWALMGGVSVNLSENAKLDLGYRYMNSGVYTSLPGMTTGAVKTSRLTSQEVKLGIRYMID